MPVYSAKTTLQIAGACLLMVFVIIGGAVWMATSHARQSPIAAVTLMIVVALLVAVGLAAVVFRISEGPLAAELPPSARLVDIHRRKLYPWFWRVAIVLLLVVASALITPTSWLALPAALSVVFLVIASSILSPLYLKASRFDRGMATLMANPWIHWQSTPEQEVYLGTDGLLCGGEYTPWVVSGSHLVSATASHDRLVFSFQDSTGRGAGRVEKSVPVPAGAGRDLDLLERLLRARCPNASIHIVEHL